MTLGFLFFLRKEKKRTESEFFKDPIECTIFCLKIKGQHRNRTALLCRKAPLRLIRFRALPSSLAPNSSFFPKKKKETKTRNQQINKKRKLLPRLDWMSFGFFREKYASPLETQFVSSGILTGFPFTQLCCRFFLPIL